MRPARYNPLVEARSIGTIVYLARALRPRSTMPSTTLIATIDALFDELAARGVPYLLVGGIAILTYAEGRNTEDVDLILAEHPIFAHVMKHHAARGRFGDREVDTASRTGLLLLKLYALPSLYRQASWQRAALYEGDIRLLRESAEIDEDALAAELSPFVAPHDMTELRKVLAETRPRRRFQP
jgi:hypothetical protein